MIEIIQKIGKLWLEDEYVNDDSITYKIKCTTKECQHFFLNRVAEVCGEDYICGFDIKYLRLIMFDKGDIWIDYNKDLEMIFIKKVDCSLSIIGKDELETLLNDLFIV